MSDLSVSLPSDPQPAGAGLFDAVRGACARVAEEAVFVSILTDRLCGYFDQIAADCRLVMDPDIHFKGGEDETVAFFLTLDAVNFGSGYFPAILPDPRLSGYRTIASALTDRFRAEGPFSAEDLSCITSEQCVRLFRLDSRNPLTWELAALFRQALGDLGLFLLERFDGCFSAVIEETGGSAERLVSLLAEMPLFQDTAFCRGRIVPFYKRAQITAADLHIAFGGKGVGRFDDIGALTLFADNLVPHVLRHDGLLRYDPSLAARIDGGELLESGSVEEIEIRACAVHVVELLVKEANHRHRALSPLHFDNLLWRRGQQPHYRSLARHRTLTPFY